MTVVAGGGLTLKVGYFDVEIGQSSNNFHFMAENSRLHNQRRPICTRDVIDDLHFYFTIIIIR